MNKYKLLFLTNLLLLLANPIILYLVIGELWISLLISCSLLFLSLWLFTNQSLKPVFIFWMNLVVTASIFLHAEALFTFRFSEYIIEDLYAIKKHYYFNRPYLDKTFEDKEYVVHYKTNAQGFRISAEDDSDVTVEKCDWLFIGDSYTQGAQVEFEELYTSQLYLQFPDKIIVNAGISGLGIIDEYYYYINEGYKLQPQKVFLQICNFNDFMQVERRTASISDYLMHYSNFIRYLLYDFKYANPAELPLGRWTEPFYPDFDSNLDYNIFFKQQSAQKKKDLENFKHYLQKFTDAVKKNNAELIIIQIPTKEQTSYRYLNEVLTSFHINLDELDMIYPNKWLQEITSQLQIPHIDLVQEFIESDDNLFFEYDEHLNINGHKKISDIVTQHLKDLKNPRELSYISSWAIGDRYPISSLIGDRFYYQSWRDGNFEIFETDSLLQKAKRLTWNKVDELHPWPSPQNNEIVFTEGDQAQFTTKVVLMSLDGSFREYLTPESDHYGAIPSFNSQGDLVTYPMWHFSKGHYTNPYIVVHHLSTGLRTSVTSDQFESWRPIFGKDDQQLYYISKEKNNQFDIYSYNLTSKHTLNLTDTSYEEWDPYLSPDGKKMVYASNKDGNWDLFSLDLQTRERLQLTFSAGNEWDPAFSACGKYLYFAGEFGLRNGIYRMKL